MSRGAEILREAPDALVLRAESPVAQASRSRQLLAWLGARKAHITLAELEAERTARTDNQTRKRT